MSGLYNILFGGLKQGHHLFDFEIDNKFFEQIEESEIKEGKLTAVVEAEKSSTHVDLNIRISGTVKVCCDRCLEMFDQPTECENRLLVKFGNDQEFDDPEIITVPRDEHDLDLKQFFYEFILLSLPIKRIHPDDSNGKSTCDPLMLQKLKEHLVEDEVEKDPGWEELKKLMNNN